MKQLFQISIILLLLSSNALSSNKSKVVNRQINDSITADYVVSQDGKGDFKTVQAAINAVPDYRKKRTVIYIRNGVYKEKINVSASKQLISFIGENVDKTILTYDDWAQRKNVFNEDKGTSGSASIYIFGCDFYAEKISFRNSAGPVGQAVAAHVSGDRCVFVNCRFLGFQDTLYTYSPDSRQYYKNCYIEGTTDFIFGWSIVVFDECEIRSLSDSYITAASTLEKTKYGYLFYKCKITACDNVTKVYLGRPWRNFAKTVFRECDLGIHILPAGWHNWGKAEAEKCSFYAEYKNVGKGAAISNRVAWSKQLTEEQAADWTVAKVLAGDDNWNPKAFINKEITKFK